jgi:hypothetical protein
MTFGMEGERGQSRADPSIGPRKRSNRTGPVRFDVRISGHYSKRLFGRSEVAGKPGQRRMYAEGRAAGL